MNHDFRYLQNYPCPRESVYFLASEWLENTHFAKTLNVIRDIYAKHYSQVKFHDSSPLNRQNSYRPNSDCQYHEPEYNKRENYNEVLYIYLLVAVSPRKLLYSMFFEGETS